MTENRPDPVPRPAHRPWSPTGVAVLTLIFSPLVGGIFHAINYGRLGRHSLQRFALFRNLLASLLLIAWALLLPTLVPKGLSFLFAAYFYKTQEEDFRRHVSAGGGKSSLIVAGLIALLGLGGALLLGLSLSG